MRTRIEKLTAIVLTIVVLLSLGLQTPAQSLNSSCKSVRGDVSVTFGPGSGEGAITNAGVLNGPLAATFDAGSVVFTADPTTVSFTGSTTITSLHGTIVTRDVYIYDFAILRATAMLRIDPVASTGGFAGATGVIYINDRSGTPTEAESDLSGRICYSGQ